MAKAATKQQPQGQYTTALKCGVCKAISWANNYWNEKFGGWKCAHCGAEHSNN